SLAAVASAKLTHMVQCPEASRFGELQFSPATTTVGGVITITTDFTCSLTYTIVPNYIDFYIEDHINNNGQELPILLAHRQFYSPVDKLTTVSARLRLYML
ncbi:hypothetical protein FIBSPDRAFT_746644, partial [Athelia psychrophila]